MPQHCVTGRNCKSGQTIMLQIYAAQLGMTALAARHWGFRLLKAKAFLTGIRNENKKNDI